MLSFQRKEELEKKTTEELIKEVMALESVAPGDRDDKWDTLLEIVYGVLRRIGKIEAKADEDEKEIEKQFQDRAEAIRGRHPGISDEAIREHLRKEMENQKGRDD